MENRKKWEEPKLSPEMGVKFLCLQFEYPIHCNLSWKTINLGKLSRFESKVFLLTMCLFLRPQFSNSLKFWNLSFPNISFLFMKRKPKIQEFVLSMACTRVRNCWALPKDAFSKKELNILKPFCHRFHPFNKARKIANSLQKYPLCALFKVITCSCLCR